MILVYSKKDDPSSERICQKLSCRGIGNKALFIDDYPFFSSNFSMIDNRITSNFSRMNLSNVSAIYFRLLIFSSVPGLKMPNMYRDFLSRELTSLFMGQLMTLNLKWVNNPFYAHMAGYKLAQLEQARKFGFSIPDTCISTDQDSLFDFYQKKRKKGSELITKAIHLGYVQSDNSDEDEAIFTQGVVIDSIDDIPPNQPLLLQEKIKADYEIRCFVIGDKVLAAKIEFPDSYVDYREADISLIKATPIILPQFASQACFHLTERFNLEYSAIDILCRNGEYFFIDFNSTGDWIWYEDNARLPISDAIVKLLAK